MSANEKIHLNVKYGQWDENRFVLFFYYEPWTDRVQRAAGMGPSERAGPAGVKVYCRESTEEKSEGAWEALSNASNSQKCR